MARPSHSTTVRSMIDILRLINDMAPTDITVMPKPIPIREFAQRLSMDEDQAIKFINKINYGCGDVAPEMLVFYDEDERSVIPFKVGGAFDRPLRLTPEEARGTLSALETAGYAEGEVADKIRGAFPTVSYDTFAAGNKDRAGGQNLVRLLTSAARLHRAVNIRYRGLLDDAPAERVIEPYLMRFDGTGDGIWYVHAWCRRSQGWRTFRLDRMETATLTEETFDVRDKQIEPNLAGAENAILAVHDPTSLSDAYDWNGLLQVDEPATEYSSHLSQADLDRGGYIASIPWAKNSPWLVISLLRCGSGVEVLHPSELRQAMVSQARAALAAIDAANTPRSE